jgi:hypothetical protein
VDFEILAGFYTFFQQFSPMPLYLGDVLHIILQVLHLMSLLMVHPDMIFVFPSSVCGA